VSRLAQIVGSVIHSMVGLRGWEGQSRRLPHKGYPREKREKDGVTPLQDPQCV
jgi:hypothetical protein